MTSADSRPADPLRRLSPARRVRRSIRPQDPEGSARLARQLDLPPAVARILSARGFGDESSARAHLSPTFEALHDPFGMAGVPEAVDRLGAACRAGGRVVVFGDYDCDGVGALAILTTVLKKLGADARPFIPHRLNDGYGLKLATLRRVLDEHEPEVIVTVDCGITAVEPVAEAVARGVFVIVTDHHLPPSTLPQGAILMDPKVPGCPYPFKELCGAGIAWKLAEALLVREGARAGLSDRQRRQWMISFAKIAALSTIADVVPLVGENRVLTSLGLAGLADPRAPGLAALLARSGVPAGRSPSAREVAFRIAPRLNAAGRIDHALRSLELLTTTDASRAEQLADAIERDNEERRAVQERLVAIVLERLRTSFDPDRDALVVEAGPVEEGWHRGVLGIAASRVAEAVQRPVLLLAFDGDKVAGSGRTFGRTSLYDRLAPVALRFTRDFGGHHAALGITLPAASFEAFSREARAAFSDSRDDEEWVEELVVDTEVEPAEVNPDVALKLRSFEPHGQQNPRPLVLLRELSWDGRGEPVGERGLRLRFSAGAQRIHAVGWNLARIPPAERKGRFEVVANLALDPYIGAPSLTILDLTPVPS